MSLTRLKWASLVGVGLFVLLIDTARSMLQPVLEGAGARLLLNVLIVLGSLSLLGFVFVFIERLQHGIEARNAELLALHRAALDIAGELDRETILQKVVDSARQLLAARFGALAVYAVNGRIESFLTSGLDAESIQRIGSPPEGRGLLGVVLRKGETLRLRDLGRDPRSAGFPEHHPPMSSLLAVPIVCQAPFRGNLYLAEKLGEAEFDHEDEATLTRFAAQAALALDAAHLHEQLRGLAVAEERLRLAHEMHDGLAQVLASVNAGTQAVREYLRAGKVAEATEQLDRLAAASREVYTEVREGILALRTAGRSDRPLPELLGDYIEQWQDQTGIEARTEFSGEIALRSESELQVTRIAQEALANVRKHAQASSVRVLLAGLDGEIRLQVADDGKGFDPAVATKTGSPRFGLATMRERAQAIGGTLQIDSSPGKGTRVSLRLPTGRTDNAPREEAER